MPARRTGRRSLLPPPQQWAADAARSRLEDTLGAGMAPYFVGLDLGGSGTRAALVDADGTLLAAGQGISSGHLSGTAGRRQLGRALDGALAAIAPLIAKEHCVIHAGTRGLSIAGRRESLSLELSARF